MKKKSLFLLLVLPALMTAQVSIKSVKTFEVGTDGSESVTMCATPGLLYFGANNNKATEGLEPWVSDGTTTGTHLLKNLNEGYRHSNPKWFKPALGKVIFIATVFSNTGTKTKLFITDGSESGTVELCDLSYNTTPSVSVSTSAFYGKEMNGKYYFSAETDAEEAELWVTDGTAAGTKMLKDIYATSNFASFPANFEVVNDKLFFTASNNVYGSELWMSDGTESGTVLVKDCYPGNKGYVTGQLIGFKGKLYFAAADKNSNKGIELWVSDGTEAGTVLLKDINPDYRDANPADFFVFNDQLYFSAAHYLTGKELYSTDGTPEGTVLVQDINPGTSSSNPSSFVTVGNTLFFVAKDAVYGSELRKLTAGATTVEMIKDHAAGTTDGVHPTFYSDSRYKSLGRVAFGNQLVYTAREGYSTGHQVWITDGTLAGTKKLSFNNIPGSLNIGFTTFKDEVYFWGDYYTKLELYKLSGLVTGVDDSPTQQINYRVYQHNKTLNIANLEEGSSVAIYNASGQIVDHKTQHDNLKTLEFSGLKQGIYVVAIRDGETTTSQKITIY